jgi:Ca2+/Na+ antiporter
MASSIILGTSVACLSLVAGLVLLTSGMDLLPATRRAWPFLLPASLLPLMAGFSGHLSGWHAIAMLLLGAAVLSVWCQKDQEASAAATSPAAPLPANAGSGQRLVVVLLGVGLAALGGYLAIKGCASSAVGSPFLTPAVVAAVILSPLMMLPTIGTATAVAHHGHVGRALSALVGTALLNLCLLLPLTILLYSFRYGHLNLKGPMALARDMLDPTNFPPLPFPIAAWRIDTVLLVVLGFAAVPIATGRWLLGRGEALLLIIGFMAYLAAQAFIIIH